MDPLIMGEPAARPPQAAAGPEQTEAGFRAAVESMLDCFGIYSAVRDDDGTIIDFRIEYVNAAAAQTI
jgi:hypothetical protein